MRDQPRPVPEGYRATHRGARLYVGRAANGTWYWSARRGGKKGFFADSVDYIRKGGPQSQTPEEAFRRAEQAAEEAAASGGHRQ